MTESLPTIFLTVASYCPTLLLDTSSIIRVYLPEVKKIPLSVSISNGSPLNVHVTSVGMGLPGSDNGTLMCIGDDSGARIV